MNNFNLEIYRTTRQYIKFFDVYIKQFEKNKETVFSQVGINNSSYRRARDNEQNVGKEIVEVLSKFYSLRVPKYNDIDILEKLITRIYYNIYYKIDGTIDNDLNDINKELERKSLLFPVHNLLKLFIILNTNYSPKQIYEENIDLYLDIKKYTSFFTNELLEILEIISLFFEDEYNTGAWATTYNNSMSYQILASKYYQKERYIEAIFFSSKAKEILIEDQNFSRYLSVNHTLMSSLLYSGNYKEALNVVTKHMYCIKSLKLTSSEMDITKKYLYVSLLGLKEYKKIIKEATYDESFNYTTLTCMLVALHENSNNNKYIEYKEFIDKNIDFNELDDDTKEYLNALMYYLRHKDKKLLNKFNKYEIMGSLIPILKKI